MSAAQPLYGTDLVDCAKASAKLGLEAAARNCGYGEDTQIFQRNLKEACQEMGISIESLRDLVTDQQLEQELRSVEIAPDSPSSL
jgi:hypothetical protein